MIKEAEHEYIEEYHYLPSTEKVTDCWVEIKHPYEVTLEDGTKLWTRMLCTHYGTSRSSGWAWVAESDAY